MSPAVKFPSAPLKILARDLLDRFPPRFQLRLRFEDFRVWVTSNNKALLESLTEYFEPFLDGSGPADAVVTALEGSVDWEADWRAKPPDPGKSKIKEEWVDIPGGRAVRKRLTDMVFLFGRDIHLAVGPCGENPNQVVNFINNRLIQKRLDQGCLLGHAAGVSYRGRGLALAGFSGMGKSTLALWMVSRGLDFVSNDRILVRPEKEGFSVHGVAKMPRINPGTALNNPDLVQVVEPGEAEKFSQLPPAELWTLEHKYDVLVHQVYGSGRFPLSASMEGLAILNWSREASGLDIRAVDIRERTDLIPAFRKTTGLFYLPANGGPPDPPAGDYIRTLSQCPVLEIRGGADFQAASEALLNFLKTGRL